jgi:hypothetical protein
MHLTSLESEASCSFLTNGTRLKDGPDRNTRQRKRVKAPRDLGVGAEEERAPIHQIEASGHQTASGLEGKTAHSSNFPHACHSPRLIVEDGGIGV